MAVPCCTCTDTPLSKKILISQGKSVGVCVLVFPGTGLTEDLVQSGNLLVSPESETQETLTDSETRVSLASESGALPESGAVLEVGELLETGALLEREALLETGALLDREALPEGRPQREVDRRHQSQPRKSLCLVYNSRAS